MGSDQAPIVYACGALAKDLRAVLRASGLGAHIEVFYLPANMHNRPEAIVPKLRPLISAAIAAKRSVFVGYSDCGTGGQLDALLREFPGVRRLPGAHCYEMFAGAERFAALHDDEPGTLYLTDFLALHFDALVWRGLGLDRFPHLRDVYFGNYRKVVHLAQGDAAAINAARIASAQLALAFESVGTQRDGLRHGIEEFCASS